MIEILSYVTLGVVIAFCVVMGIIVLWPQNSSGKRRGKKRR